MLAMTKLSLLPSKPKHGDFIKDLYDDKGNTGLNTQVGERSINFWWSASAYRHFTCYAKKRTDITVR